MRILGSVKACSPFKQSPQESHYRIFKSVESCSITRKYYQKTYIPPHENTIKSLNFCDFGTSTCHASFIGAIQIITSIAMFATPVKYPMILKFRQVPFVPGFTRVHMYARGRYLWKTMPTLVIEKATAMAKTPMNNFLFLPLGRQKRSSFNIKELLYCQHSTSTKWG